MRIARLGRYGLPAAAIAVVGGVAIWAARSSLQQDFAAYWVAGTARRLGLDPYVNYAGLTTAPAPWDGTAVFAHSRFLYPPLDAELFRPFAALPYLAAKALHTMLSLAAWIAAAAMAARLFDGNGRGATALSLGAGALFFPLYLHLERGQIDLLALLLLLGAWTWRARPLAAGAALAAAVGLKPALLGMLPVVAALGRWRAAAAAAGWVVLLAGATAALSGPALLHEYLADVLPRAARYGEGGTESMLLPPARLAALAGAPEADIVTIDGRAYRRSLWDGPAGASLPRLLAPESPTRWSVTLPYASALVTLVAAARATRRHRRRSLASEPLLFLAAAVACVVTSPSGWAMGLVWALPMVPLLRAGRARGDIGRPAAAVLAVALLACACPPPFAGWAALAGTAVLAGAVRAALGPAAAAS